MKKVIKKFGSVTVTSYMSQNGQEKIAYMDIPVNKNLHITLDVSPVSDDVGEWKKLIKQSLSDVKDALKYSKTV